MLKWYDYIICFGLCFLAAFMGANLYKTLTVKSGVNGSFYYQYLQEENVVYSKLFVSEELPVDQTDDACDFNGLINNYRIFANDTELLSSQTAGELIASYTLNFYDIAGNFIGSATAHIDFIFLASRTRISITLTGTTSLMLTHINEVGLNILIINGGVL